MEYFAIVHMSMLACFSFIVVSSAHSTHVCVCVYCLHCSQQGLTLSPLQHDFVWPDRTQIYFLLSYHQSVIGSIIIWVIVLCTLIMSRMSGVQGLNSTTIACDTLQHGAKKLLGVGSEPGTSDSAVSLSSTCAITSPWLLYIAQVNHSS